MQTSCEEKLRPECDLHDECGAQEEKEFMISRHEEEEEYDDDDGDDEEFTFMSFGELSLVSADEAFVDGQIKPVFPLFNQELLFDQTSYRFDEEDLPKKPPVKKIFVQTESGGEAHKNIDHDDDTSSSSDGHVVSGPYCDISSRTVVEATSSSDTCKKSNSTGFSKIWRFKDLVSRSNSDGRDAFVFLNEPPSKKPVEQVKAAGAALDRSTDKAKANKSRRTAPYSAHEVYLRNKAKEGKKRSSYLPYRPELMGFFTSVNGGFSKNVHPY